MTVLIIHTVTELWCSLCTKFQITKRFIFNAATLKN